MNLIQAVVKFGQYKNNFVIIEEENNPKRDRGRNQQLKYEHSLFIADYLNLNYVKLNKKELKTLRMPVFDDVAIDSTITGALNYYNYFHREFKNLSKLYILTFGADNLMPFGRAPKSLEYLRYRKEQNKWGNFLISANVDFVLAPGNHLKKELTFSKTNLELISTLEICNLINVFEMEFFTRFLPSMHSILDDNFTILSLDNLSCEKRHFDMIESIVLKKITESSPKKKRSLNILIKPHPACQDVEIMINYIQNRFRKFGIQTLNELYNIDSESLKGIPLEFIKAKFMKSKYVGIPSSAAAFFHSNDVMFVKSFNRKLDRLLFRSYYNFNKIHGLKNSTQTE